MKLWISIFRGLFCHYWKHLLTIGAKVFFFNIVVFLFSNRFEFSFVNLLLLECMVTKKLKRNSKNIQIPSSMYNLIHHMHFILLFYHCKSNQKSISRNSMFISQNCKNLSKLNIIFVILQACHSTIGFLDKYKIIYFLVSISFIFSSREKYIQTKNSLKCTQTEETNQKFWIPRQDWEHNVNCFVS